MRRVRGSRDCSCGEKNMRASRSVERDGDRKESLQSVCVWGEKTNLVVVLVLVVVGLFEKGRNYVSDVGSGQ